MILHGLGAHGLGTVTNTSAIQQMILASAAQYGVPANVALAIASHESGFNPSAINVNTNGTTDYGVMQLNTTVLQTYGLTPSQALDPQTNIDTAMKLLGGYINQYGNVDTALQAYASGPGTVASGAAPNATASQFISYVDSYQPPAGLVTSTPTDDSTVSSASSDDSTDPVTSIANTLGVDPGTLAIVAGLGLLGIIVANR